MIFCLGRDHSGGLSGLILVVLGCGHGGAPVVAPGGRRFHGRGWLGSFLCRGGRWGRGQPAPGSGVGAWVMTWPVQRLVRIWGLAVGNCWRGWGWGGGGGGGGGGVGCGGRCARGC